MEVNRIRRRIGIVYQAYNLFPHMRVIDNVTLAPRKVLRLPRADAERAVTELLTRFGLADKAADYPERLSGGMLSRWTVRTALAPVPVARRRSRPPAPELVAEVLNDPGAGRWGHDMVIATHEMAFARDIANRVFLDAAGSTGAAVPDLQSPGRTPVSSRIIEAGRCETRRPHARGPRIRLE